jgi:hypothetical protein
MRNLTCIIALLIGISVPLFNNAMALDDGQQLLNLFERENSSDREGRRKILTEIHQGKITISEDSRKELINRYLKESRFREEYIDTQKKEGLAENKARDKFYQEYEVGRKGYKQYYLDYSGLVSSLKDTRAIPGLLYGLAYYGGAIVPTHIISMGESAITPLMEIAKSQDRNLSSMALYVLSIWVNAPVSTEDYSITEAMRIKDKVLLNNIKIVLLQSLHADHLETRLRAVHGLGAFPEDDVISELEKVSKTDSAYSKHSSKYPVREAAKRNIEKLKAKKKRESSN